MNIYTILAIALVSVLIACTTPEIIDTEIPIEEAEQEEVVEDENIDKEEVVEDDDFVAEEDADIGEVI